MCGSRETLGLVCGGTGQGLLSPLCGPLGAIPGFGTGGFGTGGLKRFGTGGLKKACEFNSCSMLVVVSGAHGPERAIRISIITISVFTCATVCQQE